MAEGKALNSEAKLKADKQRTGVTEALLTISKVNTDKAAIPRYQVSYFIVFAVVPANVCTSCHRSTFIWLIVT